LSCARCATDALARRARATHHTPPRQVESALQRRPELLRLRALTAHQGMLHVAAAAANADLVACILRCAAVLPEAPPSCDGVPFGQAAHGGAGALAVVNMRNARGQTPLMLAAGNPAGEACVRALLAAGADPFAADMCGGRTALFYAAARDAAGCAAALLDAARGASAPRPTFPNGAGTGLADMRMLAGFCALHVAVAADARDTARVLLRATRRLCVPTLFGSYDFIACARGTTPLHLAARLGRGVIAKTILLAHVSGLAAAAGRRASAAAGRAAGPAAAGAQTAAEPIGGRAQPAYLPRPRPPNACVAAFRLPAVLVLTALCPPSTPPP
jgi:hypothetical protein